MKSIRLILAIVSTSLVLMMAGCDGSKDADFRLKAQEFLIRCSNDINKAEKDFSGKNIELTGGVMVWPGGLNHEGKPVVTIQSKVNGVYNEARYYDTVNVYLIKKEDLSKFRQGDKVKVFARYDKTVQRRVGNLTLINVWLKDGVIALDNKNN
ncbi:MAG: hypothetical protein Q4D21_07885 [Phascolarctobacterium sp.]|nr:hypothetical protein [Phascolarctobacterium sp.]